MFFKTWTIGKISGIPIKVDLSLILLFLTMTVISIASGNVKRGVEIMGIYALSFIMVTLHELMHAFQARTYGVLCTGITLSIIGGMAEINDKLEGNKEVMVAIVGPLFNFALFLFFHTLNAVFPSKVLELLALINIVIAGFNMIPNYPMDGGRVLRSLLAKKVGEHSALKFMCALSLVFLVIFIAVAIPMKSPNIAIIGIAMSALSHLELRSLKRAKQKEEALKETSRFQEVYLKSKSVYETYILAKEIEKSNKLTKGMKCALLSKMARINYPHIDLECKNKECSVPTLLLNYFYEKTIEPKDTFNILKRLIEIKSDNRHILN